MNIDSTAPVVAAVLAAGSGERMAGDVPKQFRTLGGRPLLAHSLIAFENTPEITGIVLVSQTDHLSQSRRVAEGAGITKLVAVVDGGATRSASSRAAVEAVNHLQDGMILIHDAARPLVEIETIQAVIESLQTAQATAPALPASDTIVSATGDILTGAPDRTLLRQMQTPQGFHLETLRRAYELAAQDPEFAASDDCGVVHEYLPSVAITLLPGSRRNLKITYEQDLKLAEILISGL